LVEQRIENPRVVGSIPTPATIFSMSIPVTRVTVYTEDMDNTRIARLVAAVGLLLSIDLVAHCAEMPQAEQLASGLSSTGCEAHARLNPACHFVLTGSITRSQAQEFEKFLARRASLYGFQFEITSVDGSVDAAMTLGTKLRERGATAIARGSCGTACVLVLAGGAHRSAPHARVTIDRPYPDNAIELGEHRAERYIERINNPIVIYLERMGLPGALLGAMLAVPAHESRELNAAELRTYGLTGPGDAGSR
jgi:hypothetical protein